jgi:hypothetical protein
MGDRGADAGLAAVALSVVVAAALWADVRGRPVALGAGVAGALVVESVLQRRQSAVRRAWARGRVKAAVVVAFLAVVALSVAVAPAAGLSLLAGGLVGYLALLAGVAVGTRVRGS